MEGLKVESFKSLTMPQEQFPLTNRLFISYVVYNVARKNPALVCQPVGWAELKGLEGLRYEIYTVDWRATKDNLDRGM